MNSPQTSAHQIHNSISLGERTVHALSDGQWRMPRDFLGDVRAHDALADENGEVLLPIGFMYVPGEPSVLIDTGVGPIVRPTLTGGALAGHLEALGVGAKDVDIVALTHLHVDHVGGLATSDGDPVFPSAQIVLGRQDWRGFLGDEGVGGSPGLPLLDHLEHALRDLDKRGRVTQIDGEERIAPGVTAIVTGGHTPGHAVYLIEGHGRGLLWFGDMIDCPQQLTETGWAAASDNDPERARQVRGSLWREIEDTGRLGIGSHFPSLQVGTVQSGVWRPYQ
jgi:glyoxylase-like metal-dependent hydrolase (beta-lactamase superfamily II)